MIWKKEWFTLKKQWWRLTPKTWQWYAYLIIVISIIFLSANVIQNNLIKITKILNSCWNNSCDLIIQSNIVKITIFGVILSVLIIDIISIWENIKKDEREYKIDAISERNASWFMSFMLFLALFFNIFTPYFNYEKSINFFIIFLLLWWAFVKYISFYILERKWE